MATVDGKKTGGRKRGTLNKRTRDLLEILEEHDFCPVAKLIEVCALAEKEYERSAEIYDAIQDNRTDHNIHTPLTDTAPTYLTIMEKSAADLMPYMYPKRKSVELKDPDGAVKSFAELMKDLVTNAK